MGLETGACVSFMDENGNHISGVITGPINHNEGDLEYEVRASDGSAIKSIFYLTPDKLSEQKRQAAMADVTVNLESPLDMLDRALAMSRNESFRADLKQVIDKYRI